MRRISLYSAHKPHIWLRQTPGRAGIWGGSRVVTEEGGADCDLLAVYDSPTAPFETRVPKARRVVFLTEPPQGITYNRSYLAQFGWIVSPYPIEVPGSQVIAQQSALPWFVGITFDGPNQTINLDYDDLAAMTPAPDAPAKLTVVTSTKSKLPQQKKRLALIEALKTELGEDLVVFGRGIRQVGDKMEALYGTDFHLVLENNTEPHFWTEKLADAFLAWAHPIYAGAARAPEDFPPGAMTPIDISNTKQAARQVAARVRRGLDAADRAALAEGRRRLMEEHNLFAVLDRLAATLPEAPLMATSETIVPDNREKPLKPLKRLGKALRGLRFWKN